jgi:putative acetyltransferase
MDTLTVRRGAADEPAIAALIGMHFALMRAQSPEESCHVLPAEGLIGAHLVVAEDNGAALGIGALARLGPAEGEIKSMHTLAAARGRGVARAILRALIGAARAEGLSQVLLETGSAAEFAPARALYEAEGFGFCPPFGSYREDPLSVFMSRPI